MKDADWGVLWEFLTANGMAYEVAPLVEMTAEKTAVVLRWPDGSAARWRWNGRTWYPDASECRAENCRVLIPKTPGECCEPEHRERCVAHGGQP